MDAQSVANLKYWEDKLTRWSLWYDALIKNGPDGNADVDDDIGEIFMEPEPKPMPNKKKKNKKEPQQNTLLEQEHSSCFITPPQSYTSDSASLEASKSEEEFDEKALKSYLFWTPWNLSVHFGTVPDIATNSDVAGMSGLMFAITEAFKILDPNFDDAKLQLFGFNVVFNKLTKEMRRHFDAVYDDENRSMYSLYNYIRVEYEARIGTDYNFNSSKV